MIKTMTTSSPTLTMIGDAIIDIFLHPQDSDSRFRIDEKTGELCFLHGQKIPLETSEICLGGNATNVAIGMRRLGFDTSLCAEIGNDVFAQKIVEVLHKERITQSHLLQTPHAATSFAVVLNIQAERTIFVEHVRRDHPFSLTVIGSDWVYLTSLGHKWEHIYNQAAIIVKEKGLKLALNPGTLQLQEGIASVTKLLPLTDILFMNKEEAAKITQMDVDVSTSEEESVVKKLVQALQGMGVKTVVITDGKNGSYVGDENNRVYHMGIFPHPVVERTGAGDAYATGFLAGFLQGHDVVDAMRWGTANAGSVVAHIGAQKGLLTSDTIKRRLEEQKEILAREV